MEAMSVVVMVGGRQFTSNPRAARRSWRSGGVGSSSRTLGWTSATACDWTCASRHLSVTVSSTCGATGPSRQGADWEKDIQRELAAADIVILLVTPDFVASGYCFEKELPEVLRRNAEEGVRVLPVHVKAVDLANLPFGKFQCLPANLRPISAWRDADEAWLQVARGVRSIAEELRRAGT
jgi:hypothetical protein